MSVDFVKLLPSNMRTGKWAEFIQVFQSLYNDLEVDKVKIIKTQYELEQMSDEDVISLAEFFGYNISSYEGYTSTIDYLKKELLTIIPRILLKTTRDGYKYIFYIFNLIAEVYPLLYEDEVLSPLTYWWEFNESPIIMEMLDPEEDNILFYIYKTFESDSTFDNFNWDEVTPVYAIPPTTGMTPAFLDTDNFPTLDMESFLNNLTRHILIEYKFKFIETETTFFSENTSKSFFNDIIKHKRKTEVVYFQPILDLTTLENGDTTNQNYINYDNTLSANIISKLFINNLESISKINIGNSKHDIIDASITDVYNTILELESNDIEIIEQTNNIYKVRKKIVQKMKMFNFSEIALLDESDNIILYACFPTIEFNKNVVGGFRIDLKLS